MLILIHFAIVKDLTFYTFLLQVKHVNSNSFCHC